MKTTVKFDKGRKRVTGEYHGGPYIDLFFGGSTTPIEVINVIDGSTDTIDDPDLRSDDPTIRRAAVRKQIRAWMKDQDDQWPEWYDVYLENSRY